MRKLLCVVDMLIILTGTMVSWVCTYVKIYHTVHLKYVPFVMFQLYLNKDINKYNMGFLGEYKQITIFQ